MMILVNEDLYILYDLQLKTNSYYLVNKINESLLINPTLNSIIELFNKIKIESNFEMNILYTENDPVEFTEVISYLKNHNLRCNFKIPPEFEYNYLDYENEDYNFTILYGNNFEIGLFKFNIIKTNGISKQAIIVTYKEYAFTGLSFSSINVYDEIYDYKKFNESLEIIKKTLDDSIFICSTHGEPKRLKIINYHNEK